MTVLQKNLLISNSLGYRCFGPTGSVSLGHTWHSPVVRDKQETAFPRL